jgi:hypothetical protein
METITQAELRQVQDLAEGIAKRQAELEALKPGLIERLKAGATVQAGALEAAFKDLEGAWSYTSWEDIARAMGEPAAELVAQHTRSGAKPRTTLTVKPKARTVRI